MNIPENFKAKTNKNINEHNNELINILSYLKYINNLSDNNYNSLIKTFECHDIGKLTSEYQNIFNNTTKRTPIKIRHEILSSCIPDLTTEQFLSIILHHKTLDDICNRQIDKFTESEFNKQISIISNILNIQLLNYSELTNKLGEIYYNDDILKNLNTILNKGILNYCDHCASAGITQLNIGYNTNNINLSSLTSIQSTCKNKNEDIIIISSTGSGKTESSLFWADNIQNENKSRRIFYLLPYTASINAMYKRLKSLDFSVGMIHSKAQYFLEKEIDDDKNTKIEYNMFKKYIKQITVTTINQIIKPFFSCKYYEMMLAMYSNAIFIIDEVHCYDKIYLMCLLNGLKFLKDNFNINICIMSASIPQNIIDYIQETLNISNIIKPTIDENNKNKRHRINMKNGLIENDLEFIIDSIVKGDKVLICVNNVLKAQDLYNKLKCYANSIKLIHGKFNTRDREKIEQDLNNIQVLIGTQAIEVSLDINYDVLFTELSPLDSLLQRFGRINRVKIPKDIKNIFIYEYDVEVSKKLYDENILKRTKDVLEKIDVVDENKVQEYLNYVYEDLNIQEIIKNDEMSINSLISNMKVGHYNTKNDMLNIDSKYVLPVSLYDEYCQYYYDKDYLKANSLLVSISYRQFKFDKSIKLNNSIKEYIICKYYDSEVGLTRDDVDMVNSADCFIL